MQPSDLHLAWTTTDSSEAARRLAEGAIDAGLAACVQIEGPITSVYRWKGKREETAEWRLLFKFAAARGPALRAWVLSNHGYETPEWVAVAAADVSKNYLKWIIESGSVAGFSFSRNLQPPSDHVPTQ